MKGKLSALVLCVMLLLTASANAQLEQYPRSPINREKAAVQGLLPEGALVPYQMDSLFQRIMELHHVPGVVALAIQGDSIVWKGEYGWANVEDSVPATDMTGFILASISKTFVANAAMQLWEDGLLDLDASISDYLPFEVINPFYPDSTISTRMLLAHTSSLDRRDQTWMPFIVEGSDSPLPLDSFLAEYLVPGGGLYSMYNFLTSEPGTYWTYSNYGFAVIGLIIEQISGMTLEQYSQDYLFTPLGMDETSGSRASPKIFRIE